MLRVHYFVLETAQYGILQNTCPATKTIPGYTRAITASKRCHTESEIAVVQPSRESY